MNSTIQSFFHMGQLPRKVNSISIVLVSKKENSHTIHDYRPISSCYMIYKCIAKILANRLTKVFTQLASWNQSVFV